MTEFTRVMMGDFIIHFKTDERCIYFEVYPGCIWTDANTNEEMTGYIDKDREPMERMKFKEGSCVKKIEGSFQWRGVWEGRLYFTDEEYWGEEIEELSRIYNDHITPWCKDFIKKREPGDYYDD